MKQYILISCALISSISMCMNKKRPKLRLPQSMRCLPKPRSQKLLPVDQTLKKYETVRSALVNNQQDVFFKHMSPELTALADMHGNTLLHTAVEHHAPNRVLDPLVKNGAQNIPNNAGRTPLGLILDRYKDEKTKKLAIQDFAVYLIQKTKAKNMCAEDLKQAEEHEFKKIVEELKNYTLQ